MTDGSIRASDNDRETFVTALREAYTEGRLTLDEFEERTSAAYAARTWGELRDLTSDLPAPPVLAVEQPGGQQAGQPGALSPGSGVTPAGGATAPAAVRPATPRSIYLGGYRGGGRCLAPGCDPRRGVRGRAPHPGSERNSLVDTPSW
jgi:hypothetical protein